MVYYKNTSHLDIHIGNKVFKKGEVTGSDRYIVHKGLVRVDVTEHKFNSEKSGVSKVKSPISKKDIPGVKPKIKNVRAKKANTDESVGTSILEGAENESTDSDSSSEE